MLWQLNCLSQGEDSGTSTPTTAAAPIAEDLDFSDIKKKKKSSKKKAAFDLEAFEKELNESKTKSAGGEDDDDDDIPEPNPALDEDVDLGDDDPFAQGGDAPAGVDSGAEPWLKTDRDYFYPEVRLLSMQYQSVLTSVSLAAQSILLTPACGESFIIVHILREALYHRTPIDSS